jgi:hypothetical protein
MKVTRNPRPLKNQMPKGAPPGGVPGFLWKVLSLEALLQSSSNF